MLTMEEERSDPDVYPIPREYELVDFVGSGDFGIVVKCKKRDTGDTVAIKVSRLAQAATQEASILEELMRHNLDQSNIVKLHDWYHMNNSTGLVLEMLDMTLSDYMKEDHLSLKDIRLIMQQLATALDGLKSVGVIHGDLKPDNIMLVMDQELSFTVKLIDFGLAFHTDDAVVGSSHQLPYYRAPEIMLGLPFNEAIDMWSLGTVMGLMMFGNHIFPWFFEYNQIQSICEILGQPADHLLDAGLKTKEFFIKTSDNQWTLKRHDQYWKHKISFGTKKLVFSCLDDLKTMSEELESGAEGWKQCVELLKVMLWVDATERITPGEVLSHPFITQSYLNEASEPVADEPSSSQDLTDFKWIEVATTVDDRTESDKVQDIQDGENATLECPSDTLSCTTLNLDPDSAPAPGTDTTKEIQIFITETKDTTSDNSRPLEEKKKRRKKKKNYIRHFFSWMKKTSSCCSSMEVE